MIPIDRGAEPPQLAKARAALLHRAIAEFNAHGPGSKELLEALGGYDIVKGDLYLRQHKKCAYCERTPLLLDPADKSSHPLDHMRWLPVDRTLARSLWTWQLRDLTPRGRTTRKRLGLDALADDVDGRYRDTVWPRFRDEIDRKLAVKQPAQLRAAWDKLVRDLVNPDSPLTAATWSMLDVLPTSTAALRRAQLPAPPRP